MNAIRINPAFVKKGDKVIYKRKHYFVHMVTDDGMLYCVCKNAINYTKINLLTEYMKMEVYRKNDYLHPVPIRMLAAY